MIKPAHVYRTTKDMFAQRNSVRAVRNRSTLFNVDDRKLCRIPTVYADNQILMTRDTVHAGFHIPPKTWGFLSTTDQKRYYAGAKGFFSQTFPDDKNSAGHLIVTNRVYSADDWHENIVREAHQNDAALASLEPYVNSSKEFLDAKEFFEQDTFLFVQMGGRKDITGIRDQLYKALRDVIVMAALDDSPPTEEEIEIWTESAQDVADSMGTSWMTTQPLDRAEVEWLYRHLDSPGLPTPELAPMDPTYKDRERWGLGQWQTVFASYTEEVELGRAEKKTNLRGVKFDGPTGATYACFLPMAHIPEQIKANVNWLHHASKLEFPVDVSLHFEVMDPERAEKDLEKPIRQADHQEQDDREAGVKADEANAEQRAHLTSVKARTRSSREPMAVWQCVLSVYAADKAELRRRVNTLMSHYRPMNVELVAPREDQRELFYQSLPGSGILVHDWMQKTDTGYLASGAPWLSVHVGDGKGMHQGHTLVTDTNGVVRPGVPFFHDLFNVVDDEGKAPTEAVAGFPGSGKTVSRGLKCVLEDAFKGVTQYVWDPKGDFRVLHERARQLQLDPERVDLVDLSDTRGSVSLDPFYLAEVYESPDDPEDSVDQREALATRVIKRLLHTLTEGNNQNATFYQGVVDSAVETVLENEHRYENYTANMVAVMRVLELWSRDDHTGEAKPLRDVLTGNRPAWQNASDAIWRKLGKVKRDKLGRLFFRETDGNVRAMSMVPGSLTIFVAMDMKLLEDGQQHDDDTIISDEIASLMTDYIRNLLSNKELQFEQKAATFDEWHVIRRSTGAEGLMSWLRRMGRSRRTVIRQLSQSANDFDKNSLSTVWCGRAENEEEARYSCDLLGIEASESNIARLTNMRSGQFLHRDDKGRVAWVQVDFFSDKVLSWFNTQAKDKKMLAEAEAAAIRAQQSPLVDSQ